MIARIATVAAAACVTSRRVAQRSSRSILVGEGVNAAVLEAHSGDVSVVMVRYELHALTMRGAGRCIVTLVKPRYTEAEAVGTAAATSSETLACRLRRVSTSVPAPTRTPARTNANAWP